MAHFISGTTLFIGMQVYRFIAIFIR